MQLLIGLAVFIGVVWLTTTTCARKGWPLAFGLLIGIVLQPIGQIAAMVLGIGISWFAALPGAVSVLLGPVVGSILPLFVAMMLPQVGEATAEQSVASAPCGNCGRPNAVTTRVCPRCGQRLAGT